MTCPEHSPMGGSAAHRFMKCAASFLIQKPSTAETITSDFAETGTIAHEIAATCLINYLDSYEVIGKIFNEYKIGSDDRINLDAVQAYVNECRAIMDTGIDDILIEESIYLPHIHNLFKGTIDFAVINKTGLWLRDYKNGVGVVVSAAENSQLLYYASLLTLSNPLLVAAGDDFPVNLGIMQPNYYGVFAGPDVWETSLGYVRNWANTKLLPVMRALVAPENATVTYTAGDHCQFCPVILSCELAQNAYHNFANLSEEIVEMLSDTEIDMLFEKREIVRKFMTALENVMRHRLMSGSVMQHAKLVHKMTQRVWKPEAAVALEQHFGDAAYAPRKLLSPSAVENLSSAGKTFVTEYAYKPESDEMVVAPMADRRSQVAGTKSQDVFGAFATSQTDGF